jgi:tetratricopeptide (TPR) repeat protein
MPLRRTKSIRRRRRLLAVLLAAAIACPGCAWPKIRPAKPGEGSETVVLPDAEASADGKRSAPTRGEATEACLTAAREMEAHGRDLAAIEQYERARSFQPKTRGIAKRLAVLYERQDQREKAATEYAAALKEDPIDADVWSDFAHFQFDGGDHAGAETAARTALRINRNHKLAWVNLAMSLAEQERYGDAEQALAHAVGEEAARANLALIKARHGDHPPVRTASATEEVDREPATKPVPAPRPDELQKPVKRGLFAKRERPPDEPAKTK